MPDASKSQARPKAPADSSFARIGGEPALRAIIQTFVDHVVSDIMIGFMFQGVHRGRLLELEYQHAAAHLGANVVYRGRDLAAAHASRRIAGGQFMRRRQILREALETHQVPEPIRLRWLAYQDSLRAQITGDQAGACHGRLPSPTRPL